MEIRDESNLSEYDIPEKYILKLYITGMTTNSKIAVENIKNICEQHIKGRYELEIIDIYQQPSLAESEQIIAIPTLIKLFPLPLRKLIGNMSDQKKVLRVLDLKTENLNLL
jgi:circadian clock protein KaiB